MEERYYICARVRIDGTKEYLGKYRRIRRLGIIVLIDVCSTIGQLENWLEREHGPEKRHETCPQHCSLQYQAHESFAQCEIDLMDYDW